MNYRYRDCPSCSTSSTNSHLFKASCPRAENLSFDVLKEYWRGFRRNNVFFTYFRCCNCDLVYCPVYFTDLQLTDLYSSMDDNTAGEELPVLMDTQMNYVNLISRHAGISGSILELGGDIGLLTRPLLAKSEISSVTVIEPNLEVHSSLSDVIAGRGRVVEGWQELSSNPKFDAVIAIHVLDHLLNLRDDLAKIYEILNEEGKLFFVTHDEKSILRRLLNKKWPPFCLQHPQLFNKQTMNSVLCAIGFENLKFIKTTNSFTLGHIVSVLGNLLGIKVHPKKSLFRIKINLRLGNFATVAFKREGKM